MAQNEKVRIIIMRHSEQTMAEKIRTKYEIKGTTKLDELKELDKKVSRGANIFAYTFGAIAAIIMGSGMSFIMTDIGSVIGIGDTMITGIIVGCVGLIMGLINYPIYKGILNSRKKKYSADIIRLSNEIIGKGE